MLRTFSLASAGSLLLLAGCVLFVDDRSDYTATCHFDGDARTACGLCVATSCQPQVNACCGVYTCGSAVQELDQCGRGGDCTQVLNEATSDAPARSGLGQCIKDHCAALCVSTSDGGAIPPPGGASVSCGSDSLGCTCVGEPSIVPSSGTCSPASIAVPAANVICCADTNYPTTLGSACHCHHISCDKPVAGSCACGSDVTDGQDGTSCTRTTGPCCRSTTTERCFCSDTAGCQSGFVDMGSTCAPAAITCGKGQQKVTACQ